jgi:aconitate hydratase
VLAESFERIHRSNLIGMGVLPLQFLAGESAASLGLTGRETFDLTGIDAAISSADRQLTITARHEDGESREFRVLVRIDTPQELQYFQHGGILHFVLRQLAGTA